MPSVAALRWLEAADLVLGGVALLVYLVRR